MSNWTGSDFELEEIGLKFDGEDAYESVACIGSFEEDMEVKSITKKCRGVVAKRRNRGTGAGVLKVKAHIPWALYSKAYGMELDTLKDGIKAYGRNSIHKGFALTARVLDEDGNRKFKACPVCVINTGIVRKIENGAEEVAEMDLEIGVMPDKYGNGLYEATEEELTDETLKKTWMTAFTPELAQVVSA